MARQEWSISESSSSFTMVSLTVSFCSILIIYASITDGANSTVKRGVFGEGYGDDFDQFPGFGQNHVAALPVPLVHSSPSVIYAKPILIHRPPHPSSADIASAIQAAKEANAAVMAAQQRVQEAKESVLHQQHIASQKEAQANLALQKAEAAAAIQRQEAKAASTAVVQAQQRLAHAKAEVSELQRRAAATEAHAAAIIQKSATAAAAEIQKTDHAAQKVSAIQNQGTSALKNVVAAKDTTLSAASAALEASAEADHHNAAAAWAPSAKVVHLSQWG